MNANPAAVAASREFLIDGRPLRVFDGLLPNVAEYVQALSRAAFTRTEVARPETAEYKHWATEIKLETLMRQPVFEFTRQAVAGFCTAQADYKPYRAYTNVASYGDMLFTHTDCLPEQHDLTALWYLCERWDLEWGGETLFYDTQDEIACAVTPRPGRLVVFDGAIKHVGRPPNRICYAPRYTFAIKFERVARDGDGER
ncbi:2OG-Fe(II) oxygenase [Lysobacter solisilvae (ex Woo and Kim 2022)]|uniref:2OG-Fe(II) oxygenase n=1 Tax=Agrilutibacter terrestris TaxID=2865112 RepID=A0A7H0FYW1_9GAMM|nr:2OG-Fe(II) oxygenase [Lysobacter terrestris]QNP41227.1 2OG-Fe(II) oxygenase [Lysobacter terrestris]